MNIHYMPASGFIKSTVAWLSAAMFIAHFLYKPDVKSEFYSCKLESIRDSNYDLKDDNRFIVYANSKMRSMLEACMNKNRMFLNDKAPGCRPSESDQLQYQCYVYEGTFARYAEWWRQQTQ